MEVIEDFNQDTGIKSYLVSTLKCLLADEYVLMNKTSTCLLDPTSPFNTEKNYLFQKAYNDLKKATELMSELLRQKSTQVVISINDIIVNTQLKNSSVFPSKVGAIEILLDDHLKVIKLLDSAIHKLQFLNETESLELFKAIKDKHTSICTRLNKYLKEIFS